MVTLCMGLGSYQKKEKEKEKLLSSTMEDYIFSAWFAGEIDCAFC